MRIVFNPNYENLEAGVKRHFISYLRRHKEVDCIIAGVGADFTGGVLEDGALVGETGGVVPVDWVCCKEDKLDEIRELFD